MTRRERLERRAAKRREWAASRASKAAETSEGMKRDGDDVKRQPPPRPPLPGRAPGSGPAPALRVRVSEFDLRGLRAEAEARGITISELVRELIHDRRGRGRP